MRNEERIVTEIERMLTKAIVEGLVMGFITGTIFWWLI
jgi:hypothetical protein